METSLPLLNGTRSYHNLSTNESFCNGTTVNPHDPGCVSSLDLDMVSGFGSGSTQDPVSGSAKSDFWVEAKFTTWKVASPIILITGTIGNILIIAVLRRMRSDTSTLPLFFTALAASDLCLLYVGLVPPWIEYQFGYSIHASHTVICKLIYWLFYSLGTLSAWLLVAMTVQRAISVVWPHKVQTACTRRQTHVTITVLTLVVFAMTSHLLYGLEVRTDYGGICYFSNSYIAHVLNVWLWVDLLASSFLPFSVLLLSNAVLIWKVLQSLRTTKTRLAGGCSDQVTAREKRFSSMSLTLVVVSVAFILLTGPIVFLSIVSFLSGMAVAGADRKYLELLAALANMLWYVNSSINFFLYILTGTRFRQEFKALLGLGTAAAVKRPGRDSKDF